MRPLNLVPILLFIALIITLYFSLTSTSPKNLNQFSELKLQLVSGQVLDLNDFKGQTYIIRLFSSWCGSCKKDIPALKSLAQRLNAPIIGIAMQDNINKLKQMSKDNLPYDYVAIDTDNRVAKLLRNKAVPETIVISAEGAIVFRRLGSL